MRRRDFLRLFGTTVIASRLPLIAAVSDRTPVIRTVRGDISAAELGVALTHEHVLVDFIGADQASPRRYDADEVFRLVLPHFQRIAALGVRAVFECTPNFLGRDARLLVRLSDATGIHLITNTGLYGAMHGRFLPSWAHTESAGQLAARWITEARDGVDGTGLLPGFIKCGIEPAPEMSAIDRKLIAAAALTHRETGLTITVHTGNGPGKAQLAVLQANGVAPAAFVWIHAQSAPDDDLFAAADAGAWLSFDGLASHSLTRHLHLCRAFQQRRQLDRVLLSHDAGWFDPAKPAGGTFRPYDLLSTTFLPLLRDNGFTDADITQLLITNPARAFTITPRLL